jgi:hypothetical protein
MFERSVSKRISKKNANLERMEKRPCPSRTAFHCRHSNRKSSSIKVCGKLFSFKQLSEYGKRERTMKNPSNSLSG